MPKVFLLFLLLLLTAVGVHSQTTCESILFDVYRHPVDDEFIVVEVNYSGEESYNYPSFNLIQDGESLAQGETTLFMLPQQSFHLMQIDDQFHEGEEVTLTIEMYSAFSVNYECSYEWTGVVYEPYDCFAGKLRLSTVAGVGQEIEFVVRDQFDEIILTYNIWFDFSSLAQEYDLCLPRGCYTVSAEAVGSQMQQNYLVSFSTGGQMWFNRMYPQGTNYMEHTLEIWQGCSVVSVNERSNEMQEMRFQTLASVGQLLPCLAHDAPEARVDVYSISGECIMQFESQIIETPSLPGLYVIYWKDQHGNEGAQKLVVTK